MTKAIDFQATQILPREIMGREAFRAAAVNKDVHFKSYLKLPQSFKYSLKVTFSELFEEKVTNLLESTLHFLQNHKTSKQ